MLRRRSEFYGFLGNVLSVKSETEEQKEEQPLSRHDEYLQVLLQMRMTSAVSEQRRKMILAEESNSNTLTKGMPTGVPVIGCLWCVVLFNMTRKEFLLCQIKPSLDASLRDFTTAEPKRMQLKFHE